MSSASNDTDPPQQFPESSAPVYQRAIFGRLLWGTVVFVSAVLVATAFLPLLPVDWWWVRVGDFPRAQLLTLYLLVSLGLLPWRGRLLGKVLLLLLGCGVGIQVYWIFPYLPLAPVEVEQAKSSDQSRRLRILTANVLQSNQQVAPLLRLIEREHPDVVLLCEVNARWAADLAVLKQRFSFQLVHPLENTYGMALYSNLAVSEAKIQHFVNEEIPSIAAQIQLRNGHQLQLSAVHPNPPRPGESTTKRDAELVLVGRQVRAQGTAVVLGDLNDVGWSRTTNLFQEVSQLLDPRKGRGMFPTFSAKSWIWRYPLDYLFHSDDFRVAELRTLDAIGSDHFPLLVELSYEPEAVSSQAAPHLDEGDREDAQHAVEAVESVEAGK